MIQAMKIVSIDNTYNYIVSTKGIINYELYYKENANLFSAKNNGFDKRADKENADYDADDEEVVNKSDTQLMPPPPIPEEKETLTAEEMEAARQRKLETPLASMLPSKYANINVTELFPDFRTNKVLRFSRLFGPGKPSSLPQIWRGVRKRRKKKKHDIRDSDSGSDQDDKKPKFKV